jgi:hypothetical protein
MQLLVNLLSFVLLLIVSTKGKKTINVYLLHRAALLNLNKNK